MHLFVYITNNDITTSVSGQEVRGADNLETIVLYAYFSKKDKHVN